MSLNLHPKETALVLIDLEHGIVAHDTKPYPAEQIVAQCRELAEAVRHAGGTVVYVHVLLHEIARGPADAPSSPPGAPAPPAEASELVPEAGYQPGIDVLIAKRQWGAFTATNLDQALRRRGIRTVIMGGIATNMGVESTARSAQELGYSLVFAEDAMTSIKAEMHEFSVKQIFPMMGQVRSTEEILTVLKG